MRAPTTVKGATLEPITLLMNWRPEARRAQ
jgi:hypothetical protein